MTALDAALAAGRAAAEELMREQVSLSLPGDDEFDWESGSSTPSTAASFYAGRARVKPVARSRGEEVNAGEANVTLREYVVSLPWSTPSPAERIVPGVVLDVTSSPDARLVGLRLWVTGVEYGSTSTAWRITAEDRS